MSPAGWRNEATRSDRLETSLEAAEADGRPLRLAFGPNWALAPRLELVPELSWTRTAGGEESVDFSFCLVFDLAR